MSLLYMDSFDCYRLPTDDELEWYSLGLTLCPRCGADKKYFRIIGVCRSEPNEENVVNVKLRTDCKRCNQLGDEVNVHLVYYGSDWEVNYLHFLGENVHVRQVSEVELRSTTHKPPTIRLIREN